MLKIAIDADSLLYRACYRCVQSFGIFILDVAITHFYTMVHELERLFLAKFGFDNRVKLKMIFSPKRSFRHEIYPDYKSQRPKNRMDGISELKRYIINSDRDAVLFKMYEADDIVIMLALQYGYYVIALDKDVINASPTLSYDYYHHKFVEPHLEDEVEKWYFKQALMGDDVDYIKGAPGIGEIRSSAFVNKYYGEAIDWQEFVDMFGSEVDAILNMQLVRMDQVRVINGKIKLELWFPEQSRWIS